MILSINWRGGNILQAFPIGIRTNNDDPKTLEKRKRYSVCGPKKDTLKRTKLSLEAIFNLN